MCNPVVGFASILFIALGAGASGALNMWWDADIDAVMRRTRKRPVPAGIVTEGEALGLGLALSGIAVVMLGLAAESVRCGPSGVHDLLLCRRLFDVAEALDPAEHRDRRCGRGLPPDDRLGLSRQAAYRWKVR